MTCLPLPLVSFCVPVFGTQRYLPACLDSIKEEVSTFLSLFSQGAQDEAGNGQDKSTHTKNTMLHIESLPHEMRACTQLVRENGAFSKVRELLCSPNSTLPLFEIIIVDDGTPNKADKKLFSQIIKQYKSNFLSCYQTVLKVVEHSKNLGLVEARRSAVTLAEGMWVLFVDSDDEMTGDALLHFVLSAIRFDADIVQGRTEMSCDFEASEESERQGYTQSKLRLMEEKCKRVHKGILEDGEVLRNFVLDSGHSSFLHGKLFATDLLQKAFAEIPHCYCVMSEDLLIYFFILIHARRYCGIENIVYKYFIGRGVSSNKEIGSLESWNAASTAGSVFAIIFDYIDEVAPQRVGDEVRSELEAIASNHAISNVKHLSRVIPSLQEEAHNLLVSYWGEDIIEQAEIWLEEHKK